MSNNRTRPYPKLSQRTVNQIASFIFNGMSDDEIVTLSNLPLSHVQALKHGKGDLSVKKQSLILKNKAIERVKSGKGKINGLIWFLSRRYPRQFADPVTQLSLSGATTTNNTIIVTADVAKRITERSNNVLSEIETLIADKNPELPSDAS